MVQRTDSNSNPFIDTLRAAHADGLLAKVTEVANGRRYRYEHHYPAKRIDGFREERGGTVVVLETFTRIRVRNIVAVELRTPEQALIAAIGEVARGERL